MGWHLFFRPSIDFVHETEELFNFIWPTTAALWNLRWQVNGFLQESSDATREDLEGRFLRGSGVTRANLRKFYAGQEWRELQARFAGFLLVGLCANFEGWAASIVEAAGASGAVASRSAKDLQFPSASGRGVWPAIRRLCTSKSRVTTAAFYQDLKGRRRYSGNALDKLLICYRYFKECRNCLAHNGGLATPELENAYQTFAPVAHRTVLGLRECPKHHSVARGDRVELELRGVVALGEVLHRVVTTVDAELSRSIGAEQHMVTRCRAAGPPVTERGPRNARRDRDVQKAVARAGFPRPVVTAELRACLKAAGVLRT